MMFMETYEANSLSGTWGSRPSAEGRGLLPRCPCAPGVPRSAPEGPEPLTAPWCSRLLVTHAGGECEGPYCWAAQNLPFQEDLVGQISCVFWSKWDVRLLKIYVEEKRFHEAQDQKRSWDSVFYICFSYTKVSSGRSWIFSIGRGIKL